MARMFKRTLALICILPVAAVVFGARSIGAAPEDRPSPPGDVGGNPALYDQYVGRYQVGGGHIITVSREGDRLYLTDLEPRLAGRKFELIPQSETQYSLQGTETSVRFQKNRDGQVNRLEYFSPTAEYTTSAYKLR
jgi:hypothetical protein